MPPTPESYYQEAGRAGRDGKPARAVMLYRQGDAEFHRLQLGVTFPPRRVVDAIWSGRTTGVPDNVIESARRLARELRVEHGPNRLGAGQAEEASRSPSIGHFGVVRGIET